MLTSLILVAPRTINSSLHSFDEVASYVLEDRLSPIIREYFNQSLSINSIYSLKRLFSEYVREYKMLVEEHKPVFIPPKLMVGIGANSRYLDEPLHPLEIGSWIDVDEQYLYITYWFKFPYDIWPGDGAEYEPWSIVLSKNESNVIEYQARSHWRIVHINPELVLKINNRPIVYFTDHAHTPVPIVDLEALSKYLSVDLGELMDNIEVYVDEVVGFADEGKPFAVEKLSNIKPDLYDELEDYVSMKRYARCLLEGVRKFYFSDEVFVVEVDYSVKVHVGPSRRNPSPHNPLLESWVSKPIHVKR